VPKNVQYFDIRQAEWLSSNLNLLTHQMRFRNTTAPGIISDRGGGGGLKDPAMTDFRA
jgi:hypothetical protein